MTSPITPNPGIHNVPQSTAVNTSSLFSQSQIEVFALQLFNAFALTVINAILSALGLSQFAGPIDQALLALENALQGIPQDNILGLGSLSSSVSVIELALSTLSAAVGNVIDTITNIFGFTGANQLISTLESALTNGLGGLLPAVFDNLDGSGSILSTLITDLTDGTASLESQLGGNPLTTLVDSLDGTAMSVAKLLQNFTGGANPIISTAQNVADTIVNVMTGGGSFGNPITEVESALQNIPFPNVQGTLGPVNIGSALETAVDSLWQGLTGGTATGNSLGQLANAAASTQSTAANAQTVAQAGSATLAQMAVSKPTYQSIDPTADSVFNITSLTGATATTVPVTATTSVIGMIGTPNGGVKESVIFLGQTTTGLTAMNLNIYSVNTSTGVLTLVWSSANIISSVFNTLSWTYINIPSADFITTAQGDWYAVEMTVVGTGTYALVGIPGHWLPGNGNVFPPQLGASRAVPVLSHDATGVGSFTGTSSTSFSWSHTLGSSATAILIEINTVTVAPSTVKVGGVSATLLGSHALGAGIVSLYGLLSPPTGAQTVAITFSSAEALMGNSDSYNGVVSFGTAATSSGSAGTASVSVSSAAGQLAVAAIFNATSTALSAFSQTTRWNTTDSSLGASGVFGDAAGASTVSFTATASSSWAAVGVSLVGASLSPPATISSPTYSSNVPWFGLGGSVVPPQIAPQTTEFTSSGTYTVPTWMVSGDKFDIIPVGGGAGGYGAGAFGPNDGGQSGNWTAITLQYGVDIPLTTTSFTVTVGAGGTAGFNVSGSFTPGGAGGSSTVTITGYGTVTASGAPTNTNSGAWPSYTGESPGNETFDGVTYFGGGQQNAYSSTGIAPGGGGSSGSGSGNPGGAGAAGAVWIMAYQ